MIDWTPSAGYLYSTAMIVVVGGLIFWAGYRLSHGIGKSSPARLRHGRFVWWWMLAGWVAGGALYLALIERPHSAPDKAVLALPCLGMLIGWAVGMVHGGVALLLDRERR